LAALAEEGERVRGRQTCVDLPLGAVPGACAPGGEAAQPPVPATPEALDTTAPPQGTPAPLKTDEGARAATTQPPPATDAPTAPPPQTEQKPPPRKRKKRVPKEEAQKRVKAYLDRERLNRPTAELIAKETGVSQGGVFNTEAWKEYMRERGARPPPRTRTAQ